MKIVVIISILFLLTINIFAQGIIFAIDPSAQKHHGSITFSRPVIDQVDDLSLLSGTYNLDLNLLVTPTTFLHLGLPMNFIAIGENDESGAGNIKLGVQSVQDTTEGDFSALQFFLALPTADKDAIVMSVYTEYIDLTNYFPDIYALTLQYAVQNNFTNDFQLNHYIGGDLLIPKDESTLNDPEIFLRFAIEPVVKISNFNLFFNFKTMFIVSEDIDHFSDRFSSMFGIGASMEFENLRPKFCYRLFLDEPLKDYIDGVLIFGLDFELGQ